MSFTTGNDSVFLQPTSSGVVGAGAGNDRYVVSEALLGAGKNIQITDTSGSNTLHLVGGLTISSSSVTSDAVNLVLSNGSQITLLGASSFTFLTGGTGLTTAGTTSQSFSQFVTNTLGLASVPTGSTPVSGRPDRIISDSGGSGSQAFTLTSTAASAEEGGPATFQVTLDKAPTSAVTVNYVTATGTAGLGDYVSAAGQVTFAAGQTVAFINVSTVEDSAFEADETFTVSFFGSSLSGTVSATGTITNDDVDTANLPQTFTLTTGVDNILGGAGGDSISGVIANSGAANTTGTTFQAGDAVNGGAGTDTLNISVSGGTAGTNAAVTLTGVEKVLVNNVNGATQSISLALADSSLATVGHSASNAGSVTTFTGLNKLVASELSNGDAGITLTYNSTVVSGSSDAATLTLSNQTGGTFTSDGVETLNIVSNTSANTIGLGSSHTTVNVSGSANLALGAVPATVATLNASAATGNLSATLSSLATQVVTGGAGNDTITTGTTLSGVGAVNAGAGTDTLVTTADTAIAFAADGARYTNFETLSVLSTGLGANATRTQDMSQVAGITTMNVTSARADGTAGDTTHGVTLSNISATTNTLNITGLANTDATAGDDLTVTVTGTRAINTTADAMTVNLGSSTATSGSTQLAVGAAGAGVILNVSLANEESITLNSNGGASGTNFIGTLTDTSATTVTATGARALSVGAFSATVTRTVDASAMTGAFIMGTNAGTVASTITGGSASDTLVGGSAADNISGGAGNDSITGANGNDVIAGGAGNDTINAGAGIDNLSGGDGNDTFNVTLAADFTSLASAEVVSGGAGNDNLSFVETNTPITVAATDLLGINSVETITLNGGTAAGTITLTDAVYTANGAATLSIVDGLLTGGALNVNASALTAANAVSTTGNTSNGVNDSLVGGAGADSFLFSTTTGLEAGDTVTGGAGTDTITLSAVAAPVTGDLTATTGVERVVTTGTAGDVIITVGADTVIAAAGTLTVDASSVTIGDYDLAYNGSAVNTATKVQNVTGTAGDDTIAGGSGNDIITGGDGNDSITGGVGIDNLSGGSGNDIFVVATLGAGFVGLTTAETVSGGAGNDTLQFAAGTLTVAASDLVNVSGIERIEIQNSSQTASLTLTDAWFTANGTTALAINSTTATSGALTLAASLLTAANSIQLTMDNVANSAGHVINMGAGNDTLTLDLDVLNNTATIAGGTGTDTLVITANTAGGTITQGANVTGWETVSFATAGVAGTFATTTNDAGVAAGATQTINGSNITGTLLWNGAAELDGKFSITGGAGADSLTGGSLVDTITSGAGNDVITGGSGADVLAGGIGADTFVYESVAQSNGSNMDSISDFTTGTDKLQVTLSYSTLTTALDINAVRSSAGVAGTSLAQDTLSGQRGQYVYDTSSSSLFINFNADNLLTTADYKIGINAASTATASIVDGDINFVITGGSGADIITAGGGADTISGGTGGDSVTAGGGADSITGGTGSDTLNGGDGNDTISSGGGTDSIIGGAGIDSITAGGGTDTIVLGTTESSVDAVLSFTSATDKLRFSGSVLNNTSATLVDAGNLSAITTIDAAIGVSAVATQYVLSDAAFDIDTVLTAFLAAPSSTTAAAVTTAARTALNATTKTLLDATFLATETVLLVLDGTTGTSGAVFSFTNSTATGNTVDSGELVLVGVTDVVIANGDVIL